MKSNHKQTTNMNEHYMNEHCATQYSQLSFKKIWGFTITQLKRSLINIYGATLKWSRSKRKAWLLLAMLRPAYKSCAMPKWSSPHSGSSCCLTSWADITVLSWNGLAWSSRLHNKNHTCIFFLFFWDSLILSKSIQGPTPSIVLYDLFQNSSVEKLRCSIRP